MITQTVNSLMRFRVLLMGALLAALMVGLQPAPIAYGATLAVETTSDTVALDGVCSLREAIYAANTNISFRDCPAGSDTATDYIYLVDGATYSLTRAGDDDVTLYGDLDIINNSATQDVVISVFSFSGGGKATIQQDANPDDRVLHILGSQTQVTLIGVDILNGTTPSNGGGIYNEGHLTVTKSWIRYNSANRGGGIYNVGQLTLRQIEIWDNGASDQGGGVYNLGTLLAEQGHNLISNGATNHGGGIYNVGGSVTLDNMSIMGNHASRGGGVYNTGSGASIFIRNHTNMNVNEADTRGGAIYNYLGTITVTNTWLYANKAPIGTAIYNQASTAGTSAVNITSSCLMVNEGGSDFYNGESASQNATGNWWGNADGPYAGPTAYGDMVSGNVNVSNWLIIPPYMWEHRRCWLGQIARNADMQTDSDADSIPDLWTATGLSLPTDGRICGTDGICYLHLTGGRTNKQITQTISFDGPTTNSVTLEARIRGSSVPFGALHVTARFFYADGTTRDCGLTAPIGSYDWTVVSTGDTCNVLPEYTQIQIILDYQADGGKVDFDYVLLLI